MEEFVKSHWRLPCLGVRIVCQDTECITEVGRERASERSTVCQFSVRGESVEDSASERMDDQIVHVSQDFGKVLYQVFRSEGHEHLCRVLEASDDLRQFVREVASFR